MFWKSALKGLPILLLALFLSSCSEYQKVLKSADLDYKFSKAVEYYNKGKFNKALPIFDELLTQFRGSNKAEEVYYYYAQTHYALSDFILAGYHFKNFYKTFPNSKYADEAGFKSAYCNYLESPKYSLDQGFTYKAMNEIQLYVNTHPRSAKLEECNALMEELRDKLERKSFETAKQYFHMELYQAAVSAFNSTLNDFPDTQFREEIYFLRLIASYELAVLSIEEKQKQRFIEALTSYNDLNIYFPNTSYRKRADEVRDNIQEALGQLKNNNS